LARFWRDTDGASAAEYAILLAVIGTVMAVAASQLGEAIGTAINETALCINSNGGAGCG
jgi:pilus assembly protein Flp/PilA